MSENMEKICSELYIRREEFERLIEDIIELEIAKEREACAITCEKEKEKDDCAKAIRKRAQGIKHVGT